MDMLQTRRGSHLFLPSSWTSRKTLSWGVWQEKQARTSLSFSTQALMPSHNLFHKEEKKAVKEALSRMNTLSAVAWRQEGGLSQGRDQDIQVSGQHCPWPHCPPGGMAAPGTAPVAPASASCSNRIYRPLSYHTWWISSPTPFPALALHWETQRMMQHWGLTLCPEQGDNHHDSAFQDSGFLTNTYSFLSSPSQEKSSLRKSCQSRVQERKL